MSVDSFRQQRRALQSAEAASIRYDLEHLDKDGKDPHLDVPLAARSRLVAPFDEDAAVARYFSRNIQRNEEETGVPKARNRFATRASDHSDKILGHLDDQILLKNVLPALSSEDREYWFGFDEFLYMNDVGIMTRVVNYVENSTLGTDLVDLVFRPMIKDRMGAAYPHADQFLITSLVRHSVQYLWDWKNPANVDDMQNDRERLVRHHPNSESMIRRYLREASAIPNELRERLIRCNMLLQLVEKSEKTLVWGFPDSLVGLEPRVFMPIVASMPIAEDFSMYLRQLFISRQLRLLGSRKKARHEEIQVVAVARLDTDGLMRNQNLGRVFERLRFHYNTFTYFKATYAVLCNKVKTDFEDRGGTTSMTKLMAWVYYSIDKTDFKVLECLKECDELLLAHVVAMMGESWGIPVRSVSSIPRELAVHVPELAWREEERKARRSRTNAVIERKTLSPAERKLVRQRDGSPRRVPIHRSKTKGKRLDPSQLSRMDRKMLSWRLSSDALKNGPPEADTGVFLSSSSSRSGSYASSSSSSNSGSLSDAGHGLLGSLDRSGSAVMPRPFRIAVQPLQEEDEEEEAQVERLREALNKPKRRGRPKGARNRPKGPNPNSPF